MVADLALALKSKAAFEELDVVTQKFQTAASAAADALEALTTGIQVTEDTYIHV